MPQKHLPAAAFIFDLDGTLVDSLPDMRRAMNAYLADLGRRPVAPEEISAWVGDGATELVKRALTATGGLPDGPIADQVKGYLEHYRGNACIDSRPYDGVEAMLRQLKADGHLLAVCTNKPYDISVELLDGLGLTALFSAITGGDSPHGRKPSPAPLIATLDAMQAGARKALMVGDSIFDVQAARGAGLPVVAVTFGYGHVAPEELGADRLIDDFALLPQVARELI